MAELFSLHNLFTLVMLVFLQAVLGFDNLLYISLESKRVPAADQKKVRQWGIGLAIVLRIVLLGVVVKAIELFQAPFFDLHAEGVLTVDMNVHALIVLIGGVFIMYAEDRRKARPSADRSENGRGESALGLREVFRHPYHYPYCPVGGDPRRGRGREALR